MTPTLVAGGLTETFAALLVSLLVGGLALAAGERAVVGRTDPKHATLTAAIAAVALVTVDGVPFVGPLLALGVWLAIIYWRMDAGPLGTGAIAVLSWALAVIAVTIGATLGLPIEEAIGIPAT